MARLKRGKIVDFRKRLLRWYDSERRLLPWRETPSVYWTVVSEFMLQQTQIDTALPYFHRWMDLFPDFESLAEAPVESVLKAWEGLGYYNRARNLHALAKALVERGEFPKSAAEWIQMPGIGPYTSAAICSISYDQVVPVIDGNVIRVLSRLENDSTPIKDSQKAQRHFLPLAEALIDSDRPGDYNQALMELGATCCRKRKPHCLLCPVQKHCLAYKTGDPESKPVIPRKAGKKESLKRLFWVQDDKVFLTQGETGRLKGIYQYPLAASLPDLETSHILFEGSRGIGQTIYKEKILAVSETNLSQSEIEGNWIPIDELEGITLSGPHRKWLPQILAAYHSA